MREKWAGALLGLTLSALAAASQPVAAQDQTGEPPRMLALLIGNSDYDNNGRITLAAPTGNFLRDLAAPCDDINKVKDALEMLAPPGEIEITAVCNVTAAQIREHVDLISDRMTVLQSEYDLDAPPVLLIYFAGHGIQLGPRNYLFGVGAQPNLQRVAAQYLDNPNRTLLAPQAAELNSHIVQRINSERFGSPIFIIVDACREDAVPIQPASLRGLLTVGLLPDTSHDFSIPGANGSAAQPGQDMLIAFSTSGGAKAHDRSGYAEAFAQVLSRRDLTATEAFVEIRRQVLLNTGGRQVPSEIVGLMQHYCFAGCANADAQEAAFRPPLATLPRSDLPVGLFERVSWRTGQDQRQQPSMEIFYAPPEPETESEARRERTRFDIFHCAAADDGARYRRALDIAASIRDLPSVSMRGRRAEIGEIRIRRLSERANARPGYRITRDEVRYEPLDQVEVSWAETIRDLGKGFGITRVDNTTPSYMSVFVCGEPPAETPPA